MTIHVNATQEQVKDIRETIDRRNEENASAYLDLKKTDGTTFELTIQTLDIVNAELEKILTQAGIQIDREAIKAKAIYKFSPDGNMTATLMIDSNK